MKNIPTLRIFVNDLENFLKGKIKRFISEDNTWFGFCADVPCYTTLNESETSFPTRFTQKKCIKTALIKIRGLTQ